MVRAPWELTLEMVLSPDEARGLRAHVESAADRAGDERAPVVDRLIIAGLLLSGLRCSEFCGLALRDAVVATRQPVFLVRGKRSDGRTVHIPRALGRLVQSYVRTVRTALLAPAIAPHDPDGPLLVNERGRAYERTGLYRRVVAILTAAGLEEKASVQLLRHTYGYLAYLRTGGNLLFVQRQLGHAHPAITAVYAKLVDERYDELADAVGAFAEHSPAAKPPRRGAAHARR